ncbi:expressed unknown protein [Seminavis robusta]|uniref:Uncharacterized protein n=1 Tax=Seminavis robusta TaxID=568900 RepID=A0A9N8H880_9STRA|nr:expressed unknown protein [Seminavis robusta]|eukprot:Sro161_g072570.1 n/a (459) ;mRNA; r:70381-71757
MTVEVAEQPTPSSIGVPDMRPEEDQDGTATTTSTSNSGTNGAAIDQSSQCEQEEGDKVNGTDDMKSQDQLSTAADNTTEDNKNPNATSTTTTTVTTTTTNNNNAMDLNVAYEALEQVRQANVAIEFGRPLGPRECIPCLREKLVQQAAANQNGTRFQRFMANRPSIVGRAAPCLTCGTPVCPRHKCQELKRENINICIDCAAFFSLSELFCKMNDDRHNEHLTVEVAKESRKRQMNLMLDVYDRALLVLQYSVGFMEEIATALENQTKRNNQIGLGSSATGFASGIVGVAAAVTIFTPAGPPLLIASILFGGGATAASAGSEAVNYRSSANKMADTIYALHGMVHSIAGLVVDHTTAEAAAAETPEDERPRLNNTGDNSSTARNWTRAAANAIKPLTAGVLSAASVVAEAREMRATLDKINAGNPCAKAEYLRTIAGEIDAFPSTTSLAAVCPSLFDV